MDVMAMRRALIMAIVGGESMALWQETEITIPENMTTALQIKNWISGLNINDSYALIVRNDWDNNASHNGTLIVTTIYNGEIGAYVRWYNNGFNGAANWSGSYDLAADSGDKYTLLHHN